MSIEDFETALTSRLIAEYNKLNANGMYINYELWNATLFDREMSELMSNLISINPTFYEVINIPKFERFLKRHGIDVYITRMDGMGYPWAMISIG